MSRPLKTLFLLEDLRFGGTQKQNLELAARLDRSRFAPEVLSLTGPGELACLAADAGVPIHYLGKGQNVPPLFFLSLGSAIRRIAPDILVPCTAIPNIWGRIWGRFLKVPVIVGTVRGGGAPVRQHERFLWRLADHLVCNSAQLVDEMKKRGAKGDGLSYIPNGVDADLFRPGAKALSPEILCVARLAKDKDHQTLLRAFARVFSQNPCARLRLVGDGPEEGALRAFAGAELSGEVCAAIEFAGASATPWQAYARASVFALASVREGQPNAILEAMSSGLPVCATSVGGIPDLVRNGETGFLSPPRDDVALAQNILKLLESPGQRAALGACARERVMQEFSFKAMVGRHENLFERLWSAKAEI